MFLSKITKSFGLYKKLLSCNNLIIYAFLFPMKNSIFILFLSVQLFSFAQQKHFDVKWLSDFSKQVTKPDATIYFQPKNYQYRSDNLYFSTSWVLSNQIDSDNVQIKNIKKQLVPESWIKQMKFNKLPKNFKPVLKNSFAREKTFAILEINTLIKQNGQFYRLNSFDIVYNSKQYSFHKITNAQNIYDSHLSTGKWYRFKIDQTGIYKIDATFLKSLGINLEELDPHTLKIYGNGGKVMPLLNSEPYPADISEVAIQVIGESDGKFDPEDYILFYAQSHQEWSDEYDSNLNIYTNETNYFIQIDNQTGKRMQAYQPPVGTPVNTYTDYLARQFYEKDQTIFTYMGRKVFDKALDVSENTKTVEFSFPQRETDKPVFYKIKAATNKNQTNMTAFINGQLAGQANFYLSTYSVGADAAISGQKVIPDDLINIKVVYNNKNFFDAHLYLEYINISAFCRLTDIGKQYKFYHPDADTQQGIAAYDFTQAASIKQIWNITDRFNPTYFLNDQSDFRLNFLQEAHPRFIAVNPQDYYTPIKADEIVLDNQNLHKEVFYHTGQYKDLDYLIVAPEFLYNNAEQFAEMHRQNGLNVYVADLQKIYNEFGNGQQDISAIRNMIKYIYNNASSPDKRIKYVMLFGDASNDFKNLIKDNVLSNGVNSNIVPIFESLDAFNLVNSIGSDDFFVMMDDNEGRLENSNEQPDIAIGRLLVRNKDEANVLYEKYQNYLSLKTKQNWRTYVTLWADDADPGHPADVSFVTNTEEIAQKINEVHPEFNLVKIYQDAYQQVNTPGGARYPDAKRDLFNQFEKGTLILGYIGHGNEVALSHERMLTMEDIPNLHNFNRLPLMTTMTCEFARFDNPTRETTAEHMIWKKDGGVLELVSTIREIWTSNAKNMNTDFYNALFGLESTMQGVIIKNPAEALRLAKVYTNSGIGKYNIAFLGDPGFDLGFANPKIVLTSVNNKPTDTLRALQHVTVKGEIQNVDGQIMSQYNGSIFPIVFDKYVQDETLDNDGNGFQLPFKKLGAKLFQGKSDIINGQFSFEFIVPKDVNLNYGKGRLSFYAVNETSEKIGADENIIIGGVDTQAAEDHEPPEIKAYLNNRDFVSGGLTNTNPFLILDLQDEHGINTTGGIGHDITAYLDDDQTQVYILNDFYETENNTYKQGSVKYRLYNISPGWHTLHIKAWDVYNNSRTTSLDFQVVEDDDLQIDHVLNYPNPFINYTEFWFNHNHPFENLDVLLQVFTISGKLVWQHRENIYTEGFNVRDIHWDGRDDFGNKLAKGVYIYKLSVRTETGKTAQKVEKLVIL